MRPGPWLAALPLLVLAGCASPQGDGAAAPDPIVVTDPRDLANGTAPGSHIHDYWQGRDRVRVLDRETGEFAAMYSGSSNGSMAWFRPPDGSIVPQGTGVVEGVMDWTLSDPDPLRQLTGTGGSDFTHMELWVRTAADGEARPVTRVEDGVPFRFNVTNEQDDPPHYTLSLWEFQAVAVKEGAESVSFEGRIRLKVEALRTLPLAVFPPHPDPWNGTTEIGLLAFDSSVDLHLGAAFYYSCYGGCADMTLRPDAGKVVPYDASAVQVTIATDADAVPVPLDLQWHGSDTRALQPIAPESESPGLRTYRIPVEPGVGDSPYATQSLWEFRVHMATPEGQGAWRGTYHVTAKALR
jgi:hypothetical protein